jgi:hypothetical protein
MKIGHDYLRDADKRFEYYHNVTKRIPLSLDIFNTITEGGLAPRTFNLLLMGTHVGKTALMCDWAAHQLLQGYNILYITLEIREEEIGKRIDAKLLEIPMSELKVFPKEYYFRKIDKLIDKTKGILKIREFPGGTANANHFKHLLYELKQKENFKPDIIYIDYLNICCST